MLSLIIMFNIIATIYGHGLVLDPVGRASRWRFNESAPTNFNDNELFCGGFEVQFQQNMGKCGICGDSFSDPIPRKHENGGEFGIGVIVNTYRSGELMPVIIQLTANHMGFFYYKICNLDLFDETEECFKSNPLKLEDGNDKYLIATSEPGIFSMNLQIPADLKCNHCVLQWTYNTGNSWGICDNGIGALGCGEQENFRSCSDIAIVY